MSENFEARRSLRIFAASNTSLLEEPGPIVYNPVCVWDTVLLREGAGIN